MEWRILLALLCLIASAAVVTDAQGQTTTAPPTNTTTAPTTTTTAPTTTTTAPTTTTTAPTTTTTAPTTTTTAPTTTTTAPTTTTTAPTTTTTAPTTTTSPTTTTTSGSTTTTSQSTTTASGSTTTTSATTTTTSGSTTTTSPATTTTSSSTTTTSPTTTTTTTVAPTVVKLFNLSFSILETFDVNLANPSSTQFTEKSNTIRLKMEPLFKNKFSNLLRMVILKFRAGSTITDSNLEFSNGTTPTTDALKTILVDANATGVLSFNIDPTTINVTKVFDNKAPGMISSLPLLTLMTLLLTAVFHF